MTYQVLSINPGGGSTKVGLFRFGEVEEVIWKETIRHTREELSRFESVLEQWEWRRDLIGDICEARGMDWGALSAAAGRGGPFRPLPGGVYAVSDYMIRDMEKGDYQAEHPSLLGAPLARTFADKAGVPSYIVDPVCTDEFIAESRISGHPEIQRRSLTHALNLKAMCRRAAVEMNRRYEELRIVAVHLGSGASVSAHISGKIIDANDSSGEGPFCTQRSGGLPCRELIKWLFRTGNGLRYMEKTLLQRSGIFAYIGTDSFPELKKLMDKGDGKAFMIYKGLLHQLKKEIAAYAGVLDGKVDLIVIGGGLLFDEDFAEELKEAIEWIAPVKIYPGEDELLALAQGAYRVLAGLEKPRDYAAEIIK